MPVVVLVSSALGAYVLLAWLLVPRLEARLRTASETALHGRATILAVFAVLRSISVLTAMVAAAVGLLALALWYPLGDDPDYLAAAARVLEPYRLRLQRVPPWPFLVLGGTITTVVSLVAARLMSARARAFLEQSKQRERERLESQRAQGQWDDLAATPEMRQLDQALAETLRVRDRMEALDLPAAAKLEQVAKLEARTQELMARRGELDLARRMTVEIDLDQRPQTPLGPVEFVLPRWLKRGPLARTKAAGRLILGGATLAIAPLVLGVFLRPFGRALDERIVDLNEQSIVAAERRATQSLGGGTAVSGEWGSDDERVSQRLARRFELALGEFLVVDDGRDVLETRIRENVLDTLVAGSKGRALDVVSAFEEATDLQPLERAALRVQTRAREKQGAMTGVGETVEAETQKLSQEQPAIWQKLRERLEDEPGGLEPVTGAELASLTAATLVGAVMRDQREEALGPELEELAGRLEREVGRESIERLVRLKSTQFKTALLQGKSVDQAARLVVREELAALREASYDALPKVMAQIPRVEKMPRALVGFPPALRARPARDVDVSAVRRALTEAVERSGFKSGEPEISRLAGAFAELDDYFPAQRGGELRTARAEWLGANKIVPNDPLAWARAREPRRLERYGRATGLIIGRGPSKVGAALDFRDLTFTPRQEHVELVLHAPDGKVTSLGSFRQSVVWLALAYAADARAALLTLAPATPLDARRFLVHPAITETALQCRLSVLIEQLDALARNPTAHEEVARAEAQLAAYELAWAVRTRVFEEAVDAEHREPRRTPSWLRSEAEARLLDELLDQAVDGALKSPVRLILPERSVLRTLPQHFDPDLALIIDDCSNASDRRSFEGCVARASRRVITERGLDGLAAWTRLPPEAWVGARVDEAPYEATGDLTFITMPSLEDTTKLTAMFRVEARLAIGSPAQRPGAEEDAYFSQGSLPLDGASEALNAAVKRVLREDQSRADIVRDMAEFTVLQRIFRLAFDGLLGNQLPLERLEELMQVAARRRPVAFRAPTWASDAGLIERRLRGLSRRAAELFGAVRSERPEWARTAGAAIERCAALPDDAAALSAEALEQACPPLTVPDFPSGAWADVAPALRALARERLIAIELRKVRALMHADQSRGAETRACRSL